MTLAIGTRVGPYEILSALGAGGMGEVYRAHDARLARHVAIKVLPKAFTTDPERLARFEREARMLASLNHPNIATIHGVEDSAGAPALVMELVEGPTLAARLAQEAMPLRDALAVARQIADALEAAHDKGIIHRDLKPANVKLTAAGAVKVLDFGLAKAVRGHDANPDLTHAPTITMGATGEGMIIGTAAYMSPEQARGQPVDKRTDIWAFGCVLYEMLTGRAAFARDTISDTVASILEGQPEWERLPATTSPAIRRLLQRCLAKDAQRRLHDIADARIEIEDVLTVPTSAHGESPLVPRPADVSRWRRAAIAAGAIALVAVAIAVWKSSRPAVVAPNNATARFAIHLQPGQQFPIDTGLPLIVAISPDGQLIVFAVRDASGDRLYVRRRNELEAAPIPGTEGAIGPFFSPDGQWIGFAAGGMLRAVPIAGGALRTIAEAPNLEGASWGPDDAIVYSPQWRSGLLKVSARGGTPEPVTPSGEIYKSPHVLPDGKAVLCSRLRDGEPFLEIVEIATGTRRPLIEGANPVYLPSGQILFARANSLFAVPFNAARLEITGSPIRLVDGIRSDGNDTHFAVTKDGTLVYVPEATSESRLVWFDRQGHPRPLDPELRGYTHPRISPDGTRVVLTIPQESGGNEIWVYDAVRGTRTRLSPRGVSRPIWSADGKQITFHREGDVYSVAADDSGEPQVVLSRDDRFRASSVFPLAWSRDGRLLAFSVPDFVSNRDVWVSPVGGAPMPFLATPRDERAAMFSPDGRWIVYAAKETGREEQIYVQPYPGPGGREVISPSGGIEPIWSPTGREIFYRSVDGTQLMSVEVRTEPSFAAGTPRLLFAGRFAAPGGSYWSNYDVTRDGLSFLMLAADQTSTPRLNVVLHWADNLETSR